MNPCSIFSSLTDVEKMRTASLSASRHGARLPTVLTYLCGLPCRHSSRSVEEHVEPVDGALVPDLGIMDATHDPLARQVGES